jgi:hypothetical protein
LLAQSEWHGFTFPLCLKTDASKFNCYAICTVQKHEIPLKNTTALIPQEAKLAAGGSSTTTLMMSSNKSGLANVILSVATLTAAGGRSQISTELSCPHSLNRMASL